MTNPNTHIYTHTPVLANCNSTKQQAAPLFDHTANDQWAPGSSDQLGDTPANAPPPSPTTATTNHYSLGEPSLLERPRLGHQPCDQSPPPPPLLRHSLLATPPPTTTATSSTRLFDNGEEMGLPPPPRPLSASTDGLPSPRPRTPSASAAVTMSRKSGCNGGIGPDDGMRGVRSGGGGGRASKVRKGKDSLGVSATSAGSSLVAGELRGGELEKVQGRVADLGAAIETSQVR